MTAETMAAEADLLGADLTRIVGGLRAQTRGLLAIEAWRSINRVILVGHGDSYCASCAAEMALGVLAGIACESRLAEPFLSYVADGPPPWNGRGVVVVGVSASGNTPKVVAALKAARRGGATTLAVTASSSAAVAVAAEFVLELPLPYKQPSPGIRSFQATLAGLIGLALAAGEARGQLTFSGAEALWGHIVDAAGALDSAASVATSSGEALASLLADAPLIALAGTGPSYGVALYGAAKIIEATARPAIAKDLEEWWHVDRFIGPADLPLIVVAPPGRSIGRARELMRAARSIGRRVISITSDLELADGSLATIRVREELPEPLSPLLYHMYTGRLAAHLALRLGRRPFDAPEVTPRQGLPGAK